jgi:perosamine synthetase
MIPYGKQSIDASDIAEVVECLKSNWLTTGPLVGSFEREMAAYTGAKYATAVSSGTAALHCAMNALGIEKGDEVIVPSITFAASASCVVMQGGAPVFVDVEPDTLLIDPEQVVEKVTPRTKAIIAVDYAGQPCDYDALRNIADDHCLALVADSCHSLGAKYRGRKVGTLADLTVLSFHPVKHMTTGEGGMVLTDNEDYAQSVKVFRNHGIDRDFKTRANEGSWFYEVQNLGYNYRITDIQCALGLSQLKKLPSFLKRRRNIARSYDEIICDIDGISPLHVKGDVLHAYHLYVVRMDSMVVSKKRADVYNDLHSMDVGVNVHYIPVHLHPYYKKTYGTCRGMCPVAEEAYENILSLPMYPSLTSEEFQTVCDALNSIFVAR